MFIRNGERLGSILRDKEERPEPAAEVAPTAEPEKATEQEKSEPIPPTKAELIAQAESLGLPTYGTKADLEARIAQAGEEVDNDGDDDLHS